MMLNLDTLDTLIAIVVVLLTLSLVVQAIQAALKKLLKLKSRQLEESLLDLFETVFNPVAKTVGDATARSQQEEEKAKITERSRMATLQIISRNSSPADAASEQVKTIFTAVMDEFKEIGRVASSGKNMLESISKADLMKILQKVGPDNLRSGSINKLKSACDQFTQLKTTLESEEFNQLSGEVSVKFAKLREALSPLLNDLQCFFTSPTGFNANLLLADVLNLRAIKATDVLDLLAELQQSIQVELDKKPAEPNEALKQIQKKLNDIAQLFTESTLKIDEAIAPLRVKLREVENWYDTVMQSFEERYSRGMKTYALVLSFIVVVAMNANIFNVYDYIAHDAEARAAIIASGADVMKRYQEQLAAAKSEATPAGSPEQAASEAQQQKLSELIKEEMGKIQSNADVYAKFGFRTFNDEFKTFTPPSGEQTAAQKQKYLPKWGGKFGHGLRMLLGWLIMTALLSLGAPFWHDTLETLFGVKNLLRKRSDIKNVETKAGAGNPQT
jgi:hypothetical protein